MSSLQKLRVRCGLRLISMLCTETKIRLPKSSLYVNESPQFWNHFRLYQTGDAAASLRSGEKLSKLAKKSRLVRSEAKAALLDYFQGTSGLQFMDAENMSSNTPKFFESLARRVEIADDAEVRRALTRFLRYHPINEFEPFFESIGLKPYEFLPFLPRNMMFLRDDKLLLENYNALCNYGIDRHRIGKIYKEATEVFQYDYGILRSRLQSYQDLGLKESLVAKVIALSPCLLIGNVNQEFVGVLTKLKKLGIEYDWLEEYISLGDSYDWKRMLEVMCLLSDLDLNEKQIRELFLQHPHLLLGYSGLATISLFSFLLKFGFTPADVRNVFLQFPQESAAKFIDNLYRCYNFFREIDMGAQDIGYLVRSHPILLGSCEPKKVKSLLTLLNCGKNKLCQMLKDDPYVLEKWVFGVRVDRLQEERRVLKVRKLKTEFLLSIGFVENSEEMTSALKALRGRGAELQQRFDCLMNLGLSRDEVIHMVKLTPRILNQSKDLIETKFRVFVKDLGIPVSELHGYPKLLSYTIPRVKLRFSIYKWLKDEGAVQSKLALSTLLSCSDEIFLKSYVNSHPGGPEIWKELKNLSFSSAPFLEVEPAYFNLTKGKWNKIPGAP